MTRESAIDTLNRQHWKEAKSKDHSYTIRDNWRSAALFEEVVQYIRDHGEERYFYGKKYTYLDAGQWEFWSMGAPIKDTILINKAKIPQTLFTQ